jgi:hypothetical protein
MNLTICELVSFEVPCSGTISLHAKAHGLCGCSGDRSRESSGPARPVRRTGGCSGPTAAAFFGQGRSVPAMIGISIAVRAGSHTYIHTYIHTFLPSYECVSMNASAYRGRKISGHVRVAVRIEWTCVSSSLHLIFLL